MSDVPDDFKLVIILSCPNCGSYELTGGEGYWFCVICGWDELDGTEGDGQ
jgi:hypothetical protein